MLMEVACILFVLAALCLCRESPGFSGGILVAASVWCLIIPAMEASWHMGSWAFIPAFLGVWCGFGWLQVLGWSKWNSLLLFAFILGGGFLSGVSAGAMFFLTVQKLVPEMSRGKHPDLATLQFAAGFTLVMVLVC